MAIVCLFLIATYEGLNDDTYYFPPEGSKGLVDISVSPDGDHAVASYVSAWGPYTYQIKLIDDKFSDVTRFSFYPYMYFEKDSDVSLKIKVLETEWIDDTHLKIYATIYYFYEEEDSQPIVDDVIIVDIEEAKQYAER